VLGRICAQLASCQSADTNFDVDRVELCLFAGIVSCALCAPASEAEPKFQVDSITCALLNYLENVRPSFPDAVVALNRLASNLGTHHILYSHIQSLLSGIFVVVT
jgi:hypothetical protein